MKTKHQTSWLTTLLLFITLAVTPGKAFYNPNTGRWLNRDPIEERGGNSLFAISVNDTANFFDRLGLFHLYLTQHFEVDPATMPPSAHSGGDSAQTSGEVKYYTLGGWESCGNGCKKRVNTSMMLEIEQWFMAGVPLSRLSDGGHTVLEHENHHSDIMITHWAEPVDVDLAAFHGKCLKNACADAWFTWFEARQKYHMAQARLASANYEATEFFATIPAWELDANWTAAYLILIRETATALSASFAVTTQCGAPGTPP